MQRRKTVQLIALALVLLFTPGHLQSSPKQVLENSFDSIVNTQTCDTDNDVEQNPHCYKVCTDLHFYSNKFKLPNITIKNNPEFKKRTFYIGDIFDLENAIRHAKGKSEKEKIAKTVETGIDNLYQQIGDHYIRGNHESYYCTECPRWKVVNGIMFTHGHYLFAHEDRILYWQSGKKIKRDCYQCKFNFLEGIQQLARKYPDLHTIVYGHTHSKNFKEIVVERKRGNEIKKETVSLVNLPKGCFYLQIAAPPGISHN